MKHINTSTIQPISIQCNQLQTNNILPDHLLTELLTAHKTVIKSRTTLYNAKYQLYLILYKIWNIYIPNNKKHLLKPKSDVWSYVIKSILHCSTHSQSNINYHMKFIYQHSLLLYKLLWIKYENNNIHTYTTI
jgi:hypothetical protein